MIKRSACLLQVVMLGAGLDTRAWRLPLGADMAFFEVTAPPHPRHHVHVWPSITLSNPVHKSDDDVARRWTSPT